MEKVLKKKAAAGCCRFKLSLILTLLASWVSAQEYSDLWGVNGELWNTNSLLRDFTDVGYMSGDVAIPDWPVGVIVTNFGAVANDGVDDSQAFIDAIAACPSNHAVFVPNGRYMITAQIVVDRDYVVVRGEDIYQTVLFFPKNMGEIYPQADYGSALAKGAFFLVDGGTHKSIENITFEFREQKKMGHWEWRGCYGINYKGDVEDSWIRDIYFKNVDEGIQFGGAVRVSVINTVFDQYIGRYDFIGSSGVTRWVGHTAMRLSGAKKCLIHNVNFTGKYFHDFDIINYPSHSVVSHVRAYDMGFGHHGFGASHDLYTDIDLGKGDRPGNNFSVSDNQTAETHWGFRADKPIDPAGFTNAVNSGHIFVGIGVTNYSSVSNETYYHEYIDPATMYPTNIYLAQMEKMGKLTNLYLDPPPPVPTAPELTGDVRILNPIDASSSLSFSGYLKFDLSGLQDLSTIVKARVKVCTQNRKPGTTFTMDVASVADDSWTQDSLSTNSPPAGSVLCSVAVNDEVIYKWIELDITPFVQNEWSGDKVVSLKLSNDSGGYVGSLAGIKSGNTPQLIIERVADPVAGPPAAPTGMETTSENGYILLDWDDAPESDFATYNVYRSPNPNSGHPIAQGLVISDFADISVEENRAICEMPSDTTFFYTVTAVDEHGYESALSTEFVGTTLDPTNDPPAFSSGSLLLSNALENVAYEGNLMVTATDPESDPLFFFKVSGPDWLTIDFDGTLNGTPQSGDSGANQFTVQVNSRGGRDQAVLNIPVGPSPDVPPGAPAAPTAVSTAAGNNSVSLNWDGNTEADLFAYNIYRSTNSGSYGGALATGVGTNAYVDSTAVNGTTYHYVVTAVDFNSNESPVSGEVSATPDQGILTYTTFIGNGVSGASNNWISTTENWDNGLPVGQQGEVSINAAYDSNVSHAGYEVRHTNGTMNRQNGFVSLSIGAGSVWVIDGATAVLTQTRGISLTDAQFTLNQGTADLTDNSRDTTISGTAAMTINGGAMSIGRNFILSGGDLTVNGGTLDVGNSFANFVFSGAGSIVTFNGGTTTVGTDINLTLSKGISFDFGGTTAGSVTVDGTLSGLASMNWLPGSLMSMTITGSDEWAEAEWDADRLTYNGQNKSDLGKTWAEVTAEDGLEAGVRFDYVSDMETLGLVSVVIPSGYDQWASGWSTNIGAATNDFDFDGLDNLYEYGLDGNPTNALDQGTLPIFSKAGITFVYVHPKRSDDTNITYRVETTTNLVSGVWTNDGYTVTGTNVTGETLDFVTNEVDTVEDERFIRLKIEH